MCVGALVLAASLNKSPSRATPSKSAIGNWAANFIIHCVLAHSRQTEEFTSRVQGIQILYQALFHFVPIALLPECSCPREGLLTEFIHTMQAIYSKSREAAASRYRSIKSEAKQHILVSCVPSTPFTINPTQSLNARIKSPNLSVPS